jgi:hypothetical protein
MGGAGMLSVAAALPIMGAKIDAMGGGAAGGGAALQMMSWLGVILAVIFTGVWLYFRARGGYKPVQQLQKMEFAQAGTSTRDRH